MSSDEKFRANLSIGKLAESAITAWLMRHGYSVLPAYEIEQGNYKGPRIFSATSELVSPDLLAWNTGDKNHKIRWVEAKSKAAFTWYRKAQTYQDGIDRHHWGDYLRLARAGPWPVWLLFLHAPGAVAKDNPPGMIPPVGLFGNEVSKLANLIHHESDRHGPRGMVYWNIDSLKRLATWDEFTLSSGLEETP